MIVETYPPLGWLPFTERHRYSSKSNVYIRFLGIIGVLYRIYPVYWLYSGFVKYPLYGVLNEDTYSCIPFNGVS